MSMASPAILSNFFVEEWTQNQPQYLSGLSRALFPTTFLEIAVYGHVLYTAFSFFGPRILETEHLKTELNYWNQTF